MPLPAVDIVDMRGEAAEGNISPVSSVLEKRLREDKANGNQSILFLNRRGYNNYVSRRSCGKSIKCPNCSVTLTYHAKSMHKLPDAQGEEYEKSRREGGDPVCHICGYRCSVPEKCPECGKDHFLFMGCGTQKAEDDIASMFPDPHEYCAWTTILRRRNSPMRKFSTNSDADRQTCFSRNSNGDKGA